jgi:hypothetical protein
MWSGRQRLHTFDGMEIIRNKRIVRSQDKEKIESKKQNKTKNKKTQIHSNCV